MSLRGLGFCIEFISGVRVGLGIGPLDLSMLWFNSYGLWQTLENTVKADKSAVWEYAHFLAEVRNCSPRSPWHLQIFKQIRKKLIHKSGHPRLVLQVTGMK